MQPSIDAKLRDRQLYALLHVTQEDLRQANFFAAYIIKKRWHFEPWERRWTVYMQQAAYTTAFATAYSRPFTESRGWQKFPERLLRAFNTEQKELHKRVLRLRNLMYAHSDVSSRLVRAVSFEGYPTAIEAMPSMRFTRDELTLIQSMISDLQETISARKLDLIASIASEA